MRLIVVATAVGLAAIAGLSWVRYRQRVETARERSTEDIRRLADHIASAVRADLDRADRDARLLAAYDSAVASDLTQAKRDFENFARFHPHYFQVRILDTSGRERVRLDRTGDVVAHAAVLQDKSDRYYVTETLKLPEGDVYVSPLDWNIEFGRIEEPRRPTLRFGVRRDAAVVVLNADARTVFRALRESGAGFAGRIAVTERASGRTLVEVGGGDWTFLPDKPAPDRDDDLVGAATLRLGAQDLAIAAILPRRAVVAQAAAGYFDQLVLGALLAVLLIAAGGYAARSARNAALLEQARSGARAIEAANIELRRTRELLVERTRLAVLGEMVPAIAHEVRNPLQAMIAAVRTLEHDVTSQDSRRLVAIIADELARLGRIADELLLPGGPRATSDIDLGHVTRQVVDLLQAARAERPVPVIEAEVEAGLPAVRVVPDSAKQVLWNVIRNACEAAGPNGRVRIRVKRDGANVVAEVEDDGPGPGGKPAGAGIGLSICHELLKHDGGSLELQPSVRGGLCARISLPVAQAAEARL